MTQRKRIDIDARDVHVYGGLAIASAGVGLWWPPAALILFGLGLVIIAAVMALASARRVE